MEKQEAVKFIQQELANGRSQAEITALLSQRLGAPPERVAAFVAQQAAQLAARPTNPTSSVTPTPRVQAPPATGSRQVPVQSPPLPASPQVQSFASPAFTAPDPQASNLIDPGLDKYILQALLRSTKTSDIVMSVCEQTGMEWSQAQRLVARVSTQNRKKLTSRHNLLPLILSTLALLAGLALIFAGANELYTDWLILSSSPQAANLPPEVYDIAPQSGIWALLTGLGLLIGSLVGLVTAMHAQFSQG